MRVERLAGSSDGVQPAIGAAEADRHRALVQEDVAPRFLAGAKERSLWRQAQHASVAGSGMKRPRVHVAERFEGLECFEHGGIP